MLEERAKKYVEELHRTIKDSVVYQAGGGVGPLCLLLRYLLLILYSSVFSSRSVL